MKTHKKKAPSAGTLGQSKNKSFINNDARPTAEKQVNSCDTCDYRSACSEHILAAYQRLADVEFENDFLRAELARLQCGEVA